MVKICQMGLLKLNFETRPKKRIFRFLPKISAGHGWGWKFFFANFQILGPLGCQGWVVIPQNVKKSQNHCTLLHRFLKVQSHGFFRPNFVILIYLNSSIYVCNVLEKLFEHVYRAIFFRFWKVTKICLLYTVTMWRCWGTFIIKKLSL